MGAAHSCRDRRPRRSANQADGSRLSNEKTDAIFASVFSYFGGSCRFCRHTHPSLENRLSSATCLAAARNTTVTLSRVSTGAANKLPRSSNSPPDCYSLPFCRYATRGGRLITDRRGRRSLQGFAANFKYATNHNFAFCILHFALRASCWSRDLSVPTESTRRGEREI